MLWVREVTGKDIRSTYIWCSKDPPVSLTSLKPFEKVISYSLSFLHSVYASLGGHISRGRESPSRLLKLKKLCKLLKLQFEFPFAP